MSKQQNQNII